MRPIYNLMVRGHHCSSREKHCSRCERSRVSGGRSRSRFDKRWPESASLSADEGMRNVRRSTSDIESADRSEAAIEMVFHTKGHGPTSGAFREPQRLCKYFDEKVLTNVVFSLFKRFYNLKLPSLALHKCHTSFYTSPCTPADGLPHLTAQSYPLIDRMVSRPVEKPQCQSQQSVSNRPCSS